MATRTTTKKAELKTSTAKPATEKEAPAKKTVTKKITFIECKRASVFDTDPYEF